MRRAAACCEAHVPRRLPALGCCVPHPGLPAGKQAGGAVVSPAAELKQRRECVVVAAQVSIGGRLPVLAHTTVTALPTNSTPVCLRTREQAARVASAFWGTCATSFGSRCSRCACELHPCAQPAAAHGLRTTTGVCLAWHNRAAPAPCLSATTCRFFLRSAPPAASAWTCLSTCCAWTTPST